MPESPGRPALLMRISVPAEGGMRDLAGEVGSKIAEYLGTRKSDVAGIAAAIEGLAVRVAPPGASHDIVFEFHAAQGELVVHAQCDGRSSESRHRLPART
jgi:hypothetical protein